MNLNLSLKVSECIKMKASVVCRFRSRLKNETYITGWNTINHSSTTENELWRNAGPRLQEHFSCWRLPVCWLEVTKYDAHIYSIYFYRLTIRLRLQIFGMFLVIMLCTVRQPPCYQLVAKTTISVPMNWHIFLPAFYCWKLSLLKVFSEVIKLGK